MDRWRIFGLALLSSVVFLAGLFLVAEAGRSRLRVASEDMQAALGRRVLVGELRRDVVESALATRSFLLTGRAEDLEPLRSASRDIRATAERFIAAYAGEPAQVAATARQMRFLAGEQSGASLSLLALYGSRGPAAARELARAQASVVDPLQGFLPVAEQLERYEAQRIRETRDRWLHEQRLARRLSVAGAIMTLALISVATLVALLAMRRHREGMALVAQRKDELEVEAASKAAELNEVYGHLQTVQEQERSRLARGLHDELGGLLLAARMDVTWVKQHAGRADPAALAARIERILDALDQGIDLKRRVIEELRPTLLDNMGLVAALRWQVEETCRRGQLRCTCHFPPEEPVVAPRTAIALFRVVQEALTNVQKHAQAGHVDVTLEMTATHVLLAIVDDGRGIAADDTARSQTHGLAGMRYRIAALGGRLMVGQSPEGGTEVRAIVPRDPEAPVANPGTATASAGPDARRIGGRS